MQIMQEQPKNKPNFLFKYTEDFNQTTHVAPHEPIVYNNNISFDLNLLVLYKRYSNSHFIYRVLWFFNTVNFGTWDCTTNLPEVLPIWPVLVIQSVFLLLPLGRYLLPLTTLNRYQLTDSRYFLLNIKECIYYQI